MLKFAFLRLDFAAFCDDFVSLDGRNVSVKFEMKIAVIPSSQREKFKT